MARLSWQENWLTNTPFPDNFDPLSPIPRRFNTRRLKSVAIAVTNNNLQQQKGLREHKHPASSSTLKRDSRVWN